MSRFYEAELWPWHLEEDPEHGWKKYQVRLTQREKVLLDNLLPKTFLNAIAERYSFDPDKTPFRSAIFASAFAFMTNARIEHRQKSGELAKSQKLREEKLRAHEKFVAAFKIEFPEDPSMEKPEGGTGLDELKRIVSEAIAHQDKDRAFMELYKFWDEYPILGEFVRNVGDEALYREYENLPSKGRPKAVSTFQFVATLADFWEAELDRPLKLDTHNSQVITDAGRFIRDCAEPINNLQNKEYEKITDSKITSMIRRYRTEKANQKNDLHKIDDWQ